MKTYNSILFAKYLLALAFARKQPLNNTKLQKLIYLVYGYYLGKKAHLIIDETPKIWPYGPVFPRVHKAVETTKVPDISSDEFAEIREDKELTDFLNIVIDRYGKFSAAQLSNWSHMEGGPWDLTVKDAAGKWNTPIPAEYIQTYFSELTTI